MNDLKKGEIRPDVAKLQSRMGPYYIEAYRKFAEIKEKEGINIKGLLSKDFDLYLEFGRFQDKYFLNLDIPWNKIPSDVTIKREDADGVPVEWIINPESSEKGIIFYLFGGGYIFGNLDNRKWNPYLLGKFSKSKVINIGYRLAPEHPYPAAIKDSVTAYKWLLSTGVDPKEIIIAGASAGGGLTVATLLELRRRKIELPAGAVLLSPYADLVFTGDSYVTNMKYNPDSSMEGLRALARLYHQDADPKEPLISPVYADLTGLPPMLIQAGSIEVFTSDSVKLAENAKKAEVDAKLKIFDDMPHVFHSFGEELNESKQALQEIAEFISNELS